MNWYLNVLKNYVGFTGRARRKEYWLFTLFNVIVSIVLVTLETIADIPGVLSAVYSLAVLLPSLAVTVRRLHDIGKSGWWILIGLVPFVGFIVLLVFTILDSQGHNQYGPNPKNFNS